MNGETTASELRDRLGSGERIYLLDVREDIEVAEGIISGAHHFAMSRLSFESSELITQLSSVESPIVVYCKMGGRSAEVIKMLEASGLGNLENLLGGIVAWNQL